MVDVGVADDGGNLRCTVIGRNEQVLRLADAAADHIMNRRHAGHVLEDMREMVRRHGERLADVLERELLGEMRADILADAVREHQIMRLVGGARIGRQTGGQQHQRGQQMRNDLVRISGAALGVLVDHLAQRLDMVDLVDRRADETGFRPGKMSLRQAAQMKTGNAEAERADLVMQRGGHLVQITLIIQQNIASADGVAVSARDVLPRALIDVQHFGEALVAVHGAGNGRRRDGLSSRVEQLRRLAGGIAKRF